ncbi:MFS general substrate transporter [Lentithecium fluviatile CBS 122367]|uniref:MFS general substrate transporter n=1 Tax=Lentithecium fluviatile CBS 122367 TaxID=1168545 RepID=A0A6G1IN03_9PLEO|nr:MFS general substrate transporter [Lentithecium fluviatile CBS 122367]
MSISDKNANMDVEQSPEDKTVLGQHVDKAAKFLAETQEYPPLSFEAEKKLLRKVDWIMIPILFITATLGAVDKVALGTAAIYGLRTDTNLVGQQYSWLGSILSLGALTGMFPSSYLIHRLPSAKYLCSCSVGWSTMALLMAACTNWSSLMAVRFLMGCFEAIIVPGISLIIASWYKKSEQPPRNALVFAAASSVINGFLSWAVGHIDAKLATWQYLFLIVGSVTFAWSLFVLWFMPATPMDALFLSQEEKYHMVRRVAQNKTGVANKEWKWCQVKEAFIDPKTWIIFLFNIAINIPNGGLTTFNGIIIANLGFSSVNASLLSMPTGVMSTLSAFIFSYLGVKWHNRRCLVTVAACIVPIIGTAVVYAVDRGNVGGQMVGIYLLYTYFGPYVVGIGLAQANTAGNTKKTVVFAILYIGYAVGNLIGPQTFRADQAPAYTGGVVAMIVCYCVCIGLICLYWALCVWKNKRIAADGEQRGSVAEIMDDLKDQTDFEQDGFKYTT